ncbi:uncharacterized protein BDR25DRAFT_259887 [Lindgomyces ingoldianus]|uniref:Uncharacterized protein n=1 Tax=Lindgomyces ingoldianus TaxID=673940 RepID=A0ACB6QX99_9PLEO|nr:uncharacterized protein BDR25DRAFT_259887 [Lindgomyces ingoldianus]KAF2471506.1 hypothetical protein BDR25DRAFT_259887 [Lindgomyces ingoldianus]
MKYGDTLRQRSIPEWVHFNIDYDYLKDLIKHQTTPGAGKAVSIPGQEEPMERAFGDTFFRVLKAQHDRINLFIKSKSGEIERRVDHISKRLLQLQARQTADSPGTRLPARTVEKYAKIDADVTKAGEEIRSLSRFRVAQCTGFHKILKKYKRWTRDLELERCFREEIIESPESFFELDLGYLLDQYIDVLGALRAPFDSSKARTSSGETGKNAFPSSQNDANVPARFSKAVEEGSELDFDISLATIPLGAQGSKATYWVHPDHIVEVEVMLLQQMRLFTSISTKASSSPRGSPCSSPVHRKSSATSGKYFGNEGEIGSIILDHPDTFAINQNASTVGSSEEATGTIRARAAGNARWTSSGEAAVVVGLESNQNIEGPEPINVAKLKRKHLEAFLEPFTLPRTRRNSALTEQVEQSEDAAQENTAMVQKWLIDHANIRPIAGLFAKRTRFVGLRNGPTGGLWAYLDRDIYMKSSLHKDLKSNEWVANARVGSSRFPHAVLEVHREGSQSQELIQLLDQSHLLERVRGFSLEIHTVWTCCQPEAMSTPLWMPLLDTDIRRVPVPVKRQCRNAGSVSDSASQTSPPHTGTSATSMTDGRTSPCALRNGESSATSGPGLIQAPPLRAFRKKPQRPYSEYLPPVQAEEQPRTRGYWNEYDNPESEDEGYYIYVDPNATIKFPGQELMEAWTRKAKRLFCVGEVPQESSLLSTAELGIGDDGDDDDEEEEEGEEEEETADESVLTSLTNYGAIASNRRTPQHEHDGYFSGLFRSLRNPHRDVTVLDTMRWHSERERQSFLAEIHTRQHEREMTKLRFYSTCLAAAAIIDIILSSLTITSRRKERGIVDGVILFGTISNLLLLVIAVLSMKTRQERLGWLHHVVVYVIATGIVVMDVLLLRWVLSP